MASLDKGEQSMDTSVTTVTNQSASGTTTQQSATTATQSSTESSIPAMLV